MDLLAHAGSRIAFFGGSFDPPHPGHLAVARAARDALALDTVLFAPVGAQPLKPQGSTASFADRLAMTELAIAEEPGLAISLVDAPSAGASPNYTIDTLLKLSEELPPGGTLFCLMGADSFLGLRNWRRGVEIPFIAPLIVASRPGQRLVDLAAALAPGLTIEDAHETSRTVSGIELQQYRLRSSSGDAAPLYLLPGLHVEVSASEIREQVRAGSGSQPASRELLTPAVADYIRSHHIYG
jgi:nicotinate-nucleotide adenylyltransferase